MTHITSLGTYLPIWGTHPRRVAGPDEDVLTMAVASGRAALITSTAIERVVLVTRDFPLLDGGNGAALLAGLGLDSSVEVVERSGGAPAALDAALSAAPGTLVIGADLDPAGAAAVVAGAAGKATTEIVATARSNRSLPLHARGADGTVSDYGDPRLLRERGFRVALAQLDEGDKPIALAGTAHGDAASVCKGDPPTLPTLGASSAFFALADLSESRSEGALVAVDQASLSAARVVSAAAPVRRDEAMARPLPKATHTPGPDIPISLAAYDRAFASKVTFSAARCNNCGTLSFPPRQLCLTCRTDTLTTLTPLPRRGVVYTTTTINVPIPSMTSPYSLVIVELDDVDVRVLAKVTGAEAGTASIDTAGSLVLRRVAIRSGIPDYGYAFLPDNEETAR